MTGPFLTRDQLTDLTGYKRSAEQLKWLSEKRIPHEIRADGRPVLTWRVFEEALLRRKGSAPNWEAV